MSQPQTTAQTSHTLTVVIPMNSDQFYAITETKDFDQFQVPFLGLNSLELKEEREEDLHIYRRVCIKPKTSIPKILLKFSNNQELSYEDVQIKSKTKREITFKTHAPILADHIHVDGIINVEPLDNDHCLKILKVTFGFTGPLQWFSSLIENSILSELKKTMEKLPSIVTAYKKHVQQLGIVIPISPVILYQNSIANNNNSSSNTNGNNTENSIHKSSSSDLPQSPIINKEPVAQYV
eukprot:gene1149-1456_t